MLHRWRHCVQISAMRSSALAERSGGTYVPAGEFGRRLYVQLAFGDYEVHVHIGWSFPKATVAN